MKKLLYLLIPIMLAGCYQSSKLYKSNVATINNYKKSIDSLDRLLTSFSKDVEAMAAEMETVKGHLESLSEMNKKYKYYFERTKTELDSSIAENKRLNIKIIEQEKMIEKLKKK